MAPKTWNLPLPGPRAPLTLTDRPMIMGIVNITPDSFSDGGQFLDPEAAIAHGLHLAEEGAQILDLGAESTRPGGGVYGDGAEDLSVDQELARLLPVLRGLRGKLDLPISVDTRKGAVARQALAAGADLINDVGGLADDELCAAVAEAGCPVIAMHSRGDLHSMQQGINFADVVAEVCAEQSEALSRAQSTGIDRQQVILDPGIGFGKTAQQNLVLLRQLDQLSALNRPILVGASRKSFIGAVAKDTAADFATTTATTTATDRLAAKDPAHRLAGSLAAAGWAARHGAALLRVHDVAATRQFLNVWNAIDSA